MNDKDIKKIMRYVKDDLVVRDLLATKGNYVLVDRTILLTIHKTVRVISGSGKKPALVERGASGVHQKVSIERREG
jgi:hypothetical protein